MSKGKRFNQFQHALERPDAYIGSIVTVQREVSTFHNNAIRDKLISHNPGMFKCVEEILSNAIDNKWRSMKAKIPMTYIKVATSQESNEISISNDGYPIPIEQTEFEYTDPISQKTTTDVLYPAELFFGYMLTSTNYDDSEERKTSGRNGMGAKATIVFSKKAKVEHVTNGKKFTQTFENNFTKRSKPKITTVSSKDYTKITFVLDFERFNYPGLNSDLLSLIEKTCYDTSMITGLPVYFNKKKINVTDLTKYAKFYNPTKNFIHLSTKDCEVVLMDYGEQEYSSTIKQISFVNGCYTKDGGVHVDAWKDSLVSFFVRKFNASKKKFKTSAKDVLPYLAIFIRCELDKPSFDSQTKDRLNAPTPKVPKIEDSVIAKMMKWDFVSDLVQKLEMKETMKLDAKEKKTSNKKTFGDKADDANKAGSTFSSQCTLYITEGLSAKTFVVSGRSAVKDGHDFIGAMALKGKLINVRNSSKQKVLDNTEVQLLKDILGLRVGVDYTKPEHFKTLRYGKVNILTDADDDGIHIRGLVLNFFYHLYPSLVERGDFIESLSTFVAAATKGKKREVFYSNPEYKEWEEKNTDKGVSVKYYKGLGTSTSKDAKDCFINPKTVKYITDGDEDQMMAIGFSDELADERKKWICEKDEKKDFIYNGDMSISNFVNDQLVIYHRMCITRAIPSIMDGFKESQRKVFYGIFMKKLKKTMDLERLAGSVKETTGYHHGGVSLQQAIVKMAQGYVGSNNIPFLVNDGQFGTRLQGGADCASARYISTKLENVTTAIFSSLDEPLLEKKLEDNIEVEPEYFAPVIPTVLVNGATGIASGFSTNIPCFDPVEITRWIHEWLKGDESKMDKLKPYYRGFTGEIKINGNSWKSIGRLSPMKKKGWWVVDELPIGVWTVKFKEYLEKLIDNKKTKSTVIKYNEYNTENTVRFEIQVSNDFTPDIKTNMKILEKNGSFGNMWLVDKNGVPKKHESAESILKDFCPERLRLYEKRREYYINSWKCDLNKAENKYKFIRGVIDRKIDLYKEDEELERELSGFDKVDGSHEYLLSIQMRSMTKKRLGEIEKEVAKIKENIVTMEKSTGKSLWKQDLKTFVEEYQKFLKTRKEE